MIDDKLVVGLGGMPGSGKSLVVETAREIGYDIVAMGDVVREQTRLRGLEPTPQNVGAVMLALRAESGNYVIAQKCIPKIEEQKSRRVLIDGLRSIPEADIFKAHFALFTLVSVHAPPQIRFERLKRRGRSDDPTTYEGFEERDDRELGVGVGNVIALSEQIIVNDSSIESFKVLVRENFSRIETPWLKK
ncbi:MAG: flagellar hook-basal body complex protein FliE [Nitrososphaerota archaeon]|nr:flagellar hook-basal body complex protein FliE [Nitrososphaerota archaeon]